MAGGARKDPEAAVKLNAEPSSLQRGRERPGLDAATIDHIVRNACNNIIILTQNL